MSELIQAFVAGQRSQSLRGSIMIDNVVHLIGDTCLLGAGRRCGCGRREGAAGGGGDQTGDQGY